MVRQLLFLPLLLSLLCLCYQIREVFSAAGRDMGRFTEDKIIRRHTKGVLSHFIELEAYQAKMPVWLTVPGQIDYKDDWRCFEQGGYLFVPPSVTVPLAPGMCFGDEHNSEFLLLKATDVKHLFPQTHWNWEDCQDYQDLYLDDYDLYNSVLDSILNVELFMWAQNIDWEEYEYTFKSS